MERIQGVSTFSVDEHERVGVLIESPGVDASHALLTEQINSVPGVLGTWPVYGDFSTELQEGVGDVNNTP